jgi:hypothetical protein
MDDLLKEAIADAKAVRETALANAKMALEEAFTPKLKSMLAKKIQSEMEDEDGDEAEVEEQDELSDEDDVVDPASDEEGGPVSEEDEVSDEDDEIEEAEVDPDSEAAEDQAGGEAGESVDEPGNAANEQDEMEDEDDEEPVAEEEHEDEDDELDLEAILRELEEEDEDEVSEEYEDEDVEDGAEEVPAAEQPDDSVSENDVSSDIGDADNKVNKDAADSSKTGAQGPEGEGSDSEAGKENDEDEIVKEEDEVSDEDDDIDLEEVLRALSEEDEVSDEDDEVEENARLKAEIKEHRDVVKYLRAKLNEVNLLNAKLLFSNKLFRVFGLSNEQKMKVVETFDRTKNIREIKLVYSTLAESFKGNRPIKESKGSSSKAVASTKPSKKVISEGADVRSRFKKLANII